MQSSAYTDFLKDDFDKVTFIPFNVSFKCEYYDFFVFRHPKFNYSKNPNPLIEALFPKDFFELFELSIFGNIKLEPGVKFT